MNLVFKKEKGVVILEVPRSDFSVPKEISHFAEVRGFKEIENTHITILGNSLGKDLVRSLEKYSETERKDIFDQIEKKVKDFKWKINQKQKFKRGLNCLDF